jgi:cytochrome P450
MTIADDQDISGFDSEEGAYRFYAGIREDSPVFWSERLQRWVLTRYDDVLAAYRDVARFSSRTFRNRGAGATLHDPTQDRVVEIFGKQILLLDRPEHTRLRRLVSRAFTPRSVEQMRDYTARLTRSMLDGLRGEDFDFVQLFAGPLPLSVVTEIFGISIDDRDQYRAWSDSLTITTASNQPPETLQVAFRHVAQMCTYLEELVEDRRRRPTDGLLSRMIQAEDGEDRFTTDEIVAMAMIITAAGHETTTSLLVNSLRLLLDHRRHVPQERDRGSAALGTTAAVQHPDHDRGHRAPRDASAGRFRGRAGSRISQSRSSAIRSRRDVRPATVTEPASDVRKRCPRMSRREPRSTRGRRRRGDPGARLPESPHERIGRAETQSAVPRLRGGGGRMEVTLRLPYRTISATSRGAASSAGCRGAGSPP